MNDKMPALLKDVADFYHEAHILPFSDDPLGMQARANALIECIWMLGRAFFLGGRIAEKKYVELMVGYGMKETVVRELLRQAKNNRVVAGRDRLAFENRAPVRFDGGNRQHVEHFLGMIGLAIRDNAKPGDENRPPKIGRTLLDARLICEMEFYDEQYYKAAIERLIELGMVRMDGEYVAFTESGWEAFPLNPNKESE